MTDEEPRTVPLSFVIFPFPPDYVRGAVARALQYRSEASESARDAFNSAIADSIALDGFRDASKAPPNQLSECVIDGLIHADNRLASGFLRAWAESHEELRELVTEHLRGSDLPVDGPDLRERVFHSLWDRDEWARAVDALAGGRDGLDKNDVGMMLCFVSGRLPKVPEDEVEVESPLLLEWLGRLEELSPDASEWDEIGVFLDAVAEIADLKAMEEHLSQAEALADALGSMRADYEADLQYVGIDLDSWDEQAAAKPWVIPEALVLANELRDNLLLYRPVRPQASSRDEEASRAPERAKLEAEILRISASWADLLASSPPPAPEAPDEDGTGEKPASEQPVDDTPADAAEPAVSIEGHEAALAELDRRGQEVESLRAENARLAQANADLQADRRAVDSERDELSAELSLSREMEKTWRDSYVVAKTAGAGEPGEPPAQPESVNEAVALAERSFPDQLVFALNSKSDKNSQFQKPNEVFDALAWLATVYRERRVRPGGTPHFDKLLKEACSGWSYKPGQTEVTREQFIDWYTATLDGVRYDLSHHLAKGNSRDPRSTIRIAFAWDDERRQVIVGFIGLHQRNRRT